MKDVQCDEILVQLYALEEDFRERVKALVKEAANEYHVDEAKIRTLVQGGTSIL